MLSEWPACPLSLTVMGAIADQDKAGNSKAETTCQAAHVFAISIPRYIAAVVLKL